MQDNLSQLLAGLIAELKAKKLSSLSLLRLQKRFLNLGEKGQRFYTKAEILAAFNSSADKNCLSELEKKQLLAFLQVKPVRSWSGVAVVTVLTKPWPCPGKCIFCPSDIRLPKSYLANEPGAARSLANYFDPFLQVYSRLSTLKDMGHNLDKVELIILGGTWDSYPLPYRLWFIKQLFTALNTFATSAGKKQFTSLKKFYEQWQFALEPTISNQPAEILANFAGVQEKINRQELSYNQAVEHCYLSSERERYLSSIQQADYAQVQREQRKNETASSRNVGLVIETRPDLISRDTLVWNRRFGCTKIQIGVQTLDNKLLAINGRGIKVAQIAEAFALLREFGFKIHAHLMANLLGSTPELDLTSFKALVADKRFIPDEIKLYPCALIESAGLVDEYRRGNWQPYSHQQLLELLADCVKHTPRYIRLSRMIRDFSAGDIMVGNKKTNFRQLVDKQLQEKQVAVKEIRTREIKRSHFSQSDLSLKETIFQTANTSEYFLEYITSDDRLVGFLRLSLPKDKDTAMIREVHVYGEAEKLTARGESQHLGLGKALIERAKQIAQEKHYRFLQVISAIGTREYYRRRGFSDLELYQQCPLAPTVN